MLKGSHHLGKKLTAAAESLRHNAHDVTAVWNQGGRSLGVHHSLLQQSSDHFLLCRAVRHGVPPEPRTRRTRCAELGSRAGDEISVKEEAKWQGHSTVRGTAEGAVISPL